jgi:hypothetical protein
MTTELRTYAVTIPAGTLSSAPQTTDLAMPARIVTSVRVRVPPGPRGSVGFALALAGQHVVPWGNAAWIIADDETMDWPMTNAPTSGAWQFIGYNTGLLDHTIYLQFSLEPVTSRPSSPGIALVSVQP